VFRKTTLAGAVLAFVLVANVVYAQVPTGTPLYSSLGGGPFDVVNLGNLNVHFAVPVLHKAGRGQSFTYDLSYDNSVWYPVTTGGTTTWTPVTNWGWRGQTEVATGYLAYKLSTSTTMGCTTSTYTYAYHDSFGATHVFPGAATYRFSPTHTCSTSFSGFTNTAVDNSGYQLSVTSFSNLAGTLTTRGGKVIAAPLNLTTGPASATDANGNEITVNNSGQFFDTHSATTAALTVSGTAPSPTTFVYPETSGNATYTMNYSSTAVNIKTNFGCPGVGEYTATGVYLVSSIVLPDGSQYGFTYEQTPGYSTYTTARISKVTLPTGGTITYDYTGSNDGTNCADGSAVNLTRTLSPGGTWTYARSDVSGKHWQTTVTTPPDPDNSNVANQMVIQFQQDGATPASANTNNFYETERQVYEGTSTSGTILATTFTCYNGNSIGTPASCPTTAVASPFGEITAFRYLPDASGSESETDLFFDAVNGLVSNEYDYNYGTGMVGALLRHVSTAYNTTLGNGITDHPASVKVYSSSGLVAQTTYTYDETAVTASGAIQLVSISGSRGNLTTLASQASTSTTLYRKFTYFDTGMVNQAGDLSTTNAMSNASTYTYYSAGNCVNAYSFPATIAEPLSLSRSATWDCNGGVPLSVTDENSKTTTYAYDSMWRNTDIKYPDGGETQSSFYIDNVPSYTQVQKLITTGVWDEAQTNLDGFGRPDKTANLSDPNGDDYRDITYDALGRLASVSNPYYTTGDPTYGVTDYSYDALGRTTKITNPDSTSKTFAYAGSATKSTDESGIEKVTQTDGLGRVVYVCDGVGAGTQANGAPPSPCSLPFSPTGFLSTYGYDPLGNLTLATVGAYTGFSGQTRSYSYDELSRITSETNPESGITTYTYDTGTAGDMATRVRPKANQSSSTVYTTTSYTFDALHRLTSKAYDDGTPTAHYAYDQTSAFGFSSLAKTLGRMSSAYAASGSTTLAAEVFSYDTVGRVLDNSQCFTTGCSASTTFRPMPYAYNLLGEVTSSAYINGITFSYGYDNVGRMTSVTSSANDGNHPPSLLSNTTYNALGELTAAESGTVTGSSGFSQVWNYDTRGRTTYYRSAINGGPTIQIQSGITYWGNGDVLGFSDGILGYTWGYGYDAFNRLQSTTQTGAPQNVSYTYTYDQFGNRWHQNLVSGTGSNTLLSFDAYNHISGYSYDAAGNLLNDTVHTYTYDAEGRLSTVDTSAATYTYDALGKRVMSVTGGHTYYFGYNQGSAVAWELQDTTAYRGEIYGGMGKIATYKAGLTFFPTQDLVGTVRNNVTQDGGASESCVSLPFGDGQSCFGNAPGQPGPGFFTGQDRDTESNLDHFHFRQYNSTDGRWMVPDPAGMAAVDVANPQTWNRYAYVTNNPLSYVDPSGLNRQFPGTCDASQINCGGGVGDPGDDGGDPSDGNTLQIAFGYDPGDGGAWVTTGVEFFQFGGGGQQGGGNNPFTGGGGFGQSPLGKPKPLSAWDKAGLVLACLAGMDAENAAPLQLESAGPVDSTDSTNTTEGQGSPTGPNNAGKTVPYGGSREVPEGALNGVAMTASVGQCITNVFTAWPTQ